MKKELLDYKYHPRIMELRLALIKRLLDSQYGDETAMNILKLFAESFQCNFTLLVSVFNKDNKIVNHSTDNKRKKQEIIFMGGLFNESRYSIAKRYLNMNVNYLYQNVKEHNPDSFADEDWLACLDDEVLVCGVRSYGNEAKRFLIAFDNFLGVFK